MMRIIDGRHELSERDSYAFECIARRIATAYIDNTEYSMFSPREGEEGTRILRMTYRGYKNRDKNKYMGEIIVTINNTGGDMLDKKFYTVIRLVPANLVSEDQENRVFYVQVFRRLLTTTLSDHRLIKSGDVSALDKALDKVDNVSISKEDDVETIAAFTTDQTISAPVDMTLWINKEFSAQKTVRFAFSRIYKSFLIADRKALKRLTPPRRIHQIQGRL